MTFPHDAEPRREKAKRPNCKHATNAYREATSTAYFEKVNQRFSECPLYQVNNRVRSIDSSSFTSSIIIMKVLLFSGVLMTRLMPNYGRGLLDTENGAFQARKFSSAVSKQCLVAFKEEECILPHNEFWSRIARHVEVEVASHRRLARMRVQL